jgi:hypothetical protein
MNLKTLQLYSGRLSPIAQTIQTEIRQRNFRQAFTNCAEAHTVTQKICDGLLQRINSQKGGVDGLPTTGE